MKKASELFSTTERQAVASAITEAERNTAAEIVPVVATASGRYDRAEDLFGIVLALLALVVAWTQFQEVQPIAGDWESGQTLVLGLFPNLLIVLGSFLFGAIAATKFPTLRLPFISDKEITEEVERSAAEAFHRFRVRGTAEGTGVLIYVSMFEHRVRILGDSDIDQKLSASEWNEIRDLVTKGMRSGTAAEGLCAAIRRLGELLTPHFPAKSDDENELHNELRFVD